MYKTNQDVFIYVHSYSKKHCVPPITTWTLCTYNTSLPHHTQSSDVNLPSVNQLRKTIRNHGQGHIMTIQTMHFMITAVVLKKMN